MALRTPVFNDAKSYGFEWLRAMLEFGFQEGVYGGGDLKVTAAAGGGMKVDIAAGQGLVKGDSGVAGTGLSQGLYLVTNDAAVANALTLNAADPTNPRLDQICLRVRDSSDLGTGADDATFVVVQGAPAAGATLDNRTGAAALPNDHLRLADVLVPAASVAVTAGNVRDRRPWSRGLYAWAQQNYSGASGPITQLAGLRVEHVGNILEITVGFDSQGQGSGTTDLTAQAVLDNATNLGMVAEANYIGNSSYFAGSDAVWPNAGIAVGSHIINVTQSTRAGAAPTGTQMWGSSWLIVRELVGKTASQSN